MVEKGENVDAKHFLFFPTMFFKAIKMLVNSIPNKKILDWSKLKAFADDKIRIEILISEG